MSYLETGNSYEDVGGKRMTYRVEIAAEETGYVGRIVREDPGIIAPDGCDYIATWERQG